MGTLHTKTGARRSGDDYQDIIALDLLVEILEHPDRYQWVQVEADDFGYLDDIVALKSDGGYVVKQVKFSTNPEVKEDNLTWDDLTAQREGKDHKILPSLLQKWASSLEHIQSRYKLDRASLVSNRQAVGEIKNSLSSEGLLDFDKIKNKGVREKIIQQIGNKSKAQKFFANFHFYLDEKGLGVYENSVQRRFFSLGGNAQGWLNLKDSLRSWIRVKNEPPPDGLIKLEHIRKASLWNQLVQLPQNFEIPFDYVLPDNNFYKKFKQELLSGQRNCFVLYASPGAGKSTFLSYLYQDFIKHHIPIIRHHYFLSISDRTPGRLEHEKIAASLMNELMRDYQEALGNLANRNPDPDDLSKWLESCGAFYSKKKQQMIMIIDGLDHVWREQQSIKNLNKLFEHILIPPDGVVVVIGTQPVDETHLPAKLVQVFPREKWQELPLLDNAAVKDWLKHHKKELGLSSNKYTIENELQRLATAFYEKSEGHPLHLKYTLKALLEQDLLVTEQNIRNLPGCSHHDILSYYNELWVRLSEESREILHLFAATDFPWQQSGIIDCLDPQSLKLSQINNSLRQVKHLMISGYLGLRPFHSSVLEFIKKHEEHKSYSQKIKELALRWLQTKAPSYWKWAYEWQIQCEQGIYQPIIDGINREWCFKAIAKRYPTSDGDSLLYLGVKSCLQINDLVKFVRIGLLRHYYDLAHDYRHEVLEQLFMPQLLLEEDAFLRPILYDSMTFLTGPEIVLLAEYEKQRNNGEIVSKCFYELNGRLAKPKEERKHTLENWHSELEPMIKTAALAVHDITIDRFFNYIKANRKSNHSARICEIYANELRLIKDIQTLRQLLKKDLNEEEYNIVLKHAILLSFEDDIDFTPEIQNCKYRSSSFAVIYGALKSGGDIAFTEKVYEVGNILNLPEHEQYNYREQVSDLFYDMFFLFLANYLTKREEKNKGLIENIRAYPWVKSFISKLEAIASNLSKLLASKQSVDYDWLYNQLNGFVKPQWPDDRDFNDYGIVAEKTMYRIGFDIMLIAGNATISTSDLKNAFKSGYCYPSLWIDTYVERQRFLLDSEALSWLINTEIDDLNTSIQNFNTRASSFAKLATIAAIHGQKDKVREFIYESASNLVTHGEHKDYIIFHALETIEACHKLGIQNARKWLEQLAPLIAAIRDFTDGDDTGSLPKELAEVMAEVMPDAIPKYYMWLCSKEDYYDALSVFHTFIRTVDLSIKINQALANTAVDTESIEIISKRASDGDPNAVKILEGLKNYLGGIANFHHKPEREQETQTAGSKYEENLPNPQDFTPDRLLEYFKAAKASHPYERGRCLMPWLDYWNSTDKRDEAFQAIAKEDKRGGRLGLENYDRLYDIALSLYGKDKAYPWLVKANIERAGWSRNYTSEEEAVRRWQIVKDKYPDKWFDFIKDTMKSIYGDEFDFSVHERIIRLVKYCAFFNKQELANSITEQLIDSILDFVSPVEFTQPDWVCTQ